MGCSDISTITLIRMQYIILCPLEICVVNLILIIYTIEFQLLVYNYECKYPIVGYCAFELHLGRSISEIGLNLLSRSVLCSLVVSFCCKPSETFYFLVLLVFLVENKQIAGCDSFIWGQRYGVAYFSYYLSPIYSLFIGFD